MALGAVADGRGDGLARQHLRAVNLAIQDAVKEGLPNRLGLRRHVKALNGEKALFLGDGEGGHVGQLDEAKGQLVFLDPGGERRKRGWQGRWSAAEVGRYASNDCPEARFGALKRKKPHGTAA